MGAGRDTSDCPWDCILGHGTVNPTYETEAMHAHTREPAIRPNAAVRSELRSPGPLSGLAVLQRTAGNRAVAGLLAVQRQRRPRTAPPAQVGSVVATPFGRFWVTTDSTAGPPTGSGIPTAVTPSRLAELRAIWQEIDTATGKLIIEEHGHAGFRTLTLERLARLMSRPNGQRLVEAVVTGAHHVTIVAVPGAGMEGTQAQSVRGLSIDGAQVRPNVENVPGLGEILTGGYHPGPGTEIVISMDPSMTDDSLVVEGAGGRAIAEPMFLALGHELIHARHGAAGQDTSALPVSEPGDPHHFDNSEEENTITRHRSRLDITENDLRAEHRLPARVSHRAGDRRQPPLRGHSLRQLHFR
jgi:hypothetical protein